MSIKFFNRNKSQGLYGKDDIKGVQLKESDREKIFLSTDKAWNQRIGHEKTIDNTT